MWQRYLAIVRIYKSRFAMITYSNQKLMMARNQRCVCGRQGLINASKMSMQIAEIRIFFLLIRNHVCVEIQIFFWFVDYDDIKRNALSEFFSVILISFSTNSNEYWSAFIPTATSSLEHITDLFQY